MRKFTILLLVLLIISSVQVKAAPEYAKWGKVAVEETEKRYRADIIDYKHIGRTNLTAQKSEEKFKLWIRSKEGNEFGVYVTILFDPSTEMIQSIKFSESN
ncbi:MAG TPA: YqzG/YhdC family protein [Candidatus Paenibacillus intestinavium]|nr:YqzG/YhdC family protein [Candidatus Paenibacillus intestinavium]